MGSPNRGGLPPHSWQRWKTEGGSCCDRRTVVHLRNRPASPPTATTAMADIQKVLGSAIEQILSDRNYKQPPAFYRLLFDIGQTYFEIPSDQIFDAIWEKRATIATKHDQPRYGLQSRHVSHKLIHPTAHSILRFASDAESDHTLAPHNPGLQRRLCAKILQDFFSSNLAAVWHLTEA